ncbi:MAG TPA: helix-turn-helix domain-containing protein [Acidimicrobiales bacterium]|jgi:AcrR family transcriptional regulator|nr:helix-turn-helix domain-containing protein [Acidimicrobiales bacterium]
MADLRARQRLEQRRHALDTALGIIAADGVDALTMQRLADELACGIGSIYRQFTSKSALLAELQRGALEVLHRSLAGSQTSLDSVCNERGVSDPAELALSRVLGAACFWVDAELTFPLEVELCRRMFTYPSVVMSDSDVAQVLPAALAVLETARQLLAAAVELEALAPGADLQRALTIIAATNGVRMTSGLHRFSATLFDGSELANNLVRDLLVAWGAQPARLTTAAGVVAELAARGELVPAVEPSH